MEQERLPWEEENAIVPREALKRLAISESGFVFDPLTGQSFGVNETGRFLLQALQRHESLQAAIEEVVQRFEGDPKEIRRDVVEFAARLRELLQ